MIDYNFFSKQMARLAAVFHPIEKDAMSEYYSKFKLFEPGEFTEAIDVIIEHHDSKIFPVPREILDVINDIRRNKPYQLPEDSDPIPQCGECHGTGFEAWINPIDGRFKAKPCTRCDYGRRIADGWRAYFRKIYKRELITDKRDGDKYQKEMNQAYGGQG